MARSVRLCGVFVCLAALAATAVPAVARQVRISELRQLVGQTVTVRGRTGIIVETQGTTEWHVFTLRDDYGDQVHVRSRADYPIMGATWDISGIPRIDEAGDALYLEENSRARTYPTVTRLPSWLLPSTAAIVLLGMSAVALMLRRRALKAELPPAWGFAEIVPGPDQGRNFALRGDEILVGREQDPARAVSIVLDQRVSRAHGKILKTGDELFYEDTLSKCGSWVNEMKANPGQRMALKSGSLIRLGTQTILRVGLSGGANETRDWGGSLSQDVGEAATGNAGEAQTGAVRVE